MNPDRRFRGILVKLVVFAAFSALITTIVAESLLDLHVKPTKDYHAVFTNVTGLQSGDTVRVAGVEVGKVNSVGLQGTQAVVSFSVDSSQHLTTTTRAEIHYENVVGQRFLAIIAGPGGGQALRNGATIPLGHTQPGLDLTQVFSGFQPLFAALSPDEVNRLTASIIAVFQGESGTVNDLVSQTAVLTDNLAQRQQVIDQVLVNLSGLVDAVAGHNQQLGQLIDQFSSFVGGLANERTQIGATISGLSGLTNSFNNQLTQSQPALNQDIGQLASVTGSLAANQQSINAAITSFPAFLTTLDKVSSNGSFLSVYLCNLSITTAGTPDISLIPGVPAPQPGDPLTLPTGSAIGDQNQHTVNCQ
jgi:phospholipid/cholesterol/gamma-HCH transport system substrate-binding protein